MRAVGIIGHGADKFTAAGKRRAITVIESLLIEADCVVSGHSPVGGIDIWSEDIAREAEIALDLKAPTTNAWNPPGGYGFKARNIDIAADSTEVHVILVDVLPPGYQGMRFAGCYHCAGRDRSPHVKSGAAGQATTPWKLGKPATCGMWSRMPSGRGIERERQVRKHLSAEGWPRLPRPRKPRLRRRHRHAPADWLIDNKPVSEVLLIEVERTARGFYEHFGLADRASAPRRREASRASAASAWWPKNGKLTLFPSANWPPRAAPNWRSRA